MSKATRQNWNDPSDDIQEARKNFQNALYDAMIFAERYERAINDTKAESPEGRINLAGRSGWTSLAVDTLRQLYTNLR